MPQIGEKAPPLSLPDADMEVLDLADLRGRNVVLFFYPRDAARSMIEATDFSDHEQDFERADCVVLGISRDDCLCHAEFRDKYGISVRLLSDSDGDVCQSYDVIQEREVDGVWKRGIVRSTFVIDRQGIIRKIYSGVTPRGHALEVLRFVRTME